jgi:hypothetical protein
MRIMFLQTPHPLQPGCANDLVEGETRPGKAILKTGGWLDSENGLTLSRNFCYLSKERRILGDLTLDIWVV